MNFYYQIAPALIGVSIALVQPQVAVALSGEEVSQIAKDITVLIQSQGQKPRYGSGVIIKQQGNTYTVLTAAHVVDVAVLLVRFPGQNSYLRDRDSQIPSILRTITAQVK